MVGIKAFVAADEESVAATDAVATPDAVAEETSNGFTQSDGMMRADEKLFGLWEKEANDVYKILGKTNSFHPS